MQKKNICKKIILSTTLLVFLLEFSPAATTGSRIHFEDEITDTSPGEICRTPDSRTGRCVPLDSCPALLQGVGKDKLRLYSCSLEDNNDVDEPSVCCPQPTAEATTESFVPEITSITTSTSTPQSYVHLDQPKKEILPVFDSTQRPAPNVITTKLLQPKFGFKNESNDTSPSENCRTPDSRPGRCVPLDTCRALLQGVGKDKLRLYSCSLEDNKDVDETSVCCPQPTVDATPESLTPQTTTLERRTPEALFHFDEPIIKSQPIFGSTQRPPSNGTTTKSSQQKSDFKNESEATFFSEICETPYSRVGRCIRLNLCPALLQGVGKDKLRLYSCSEESNDDVNGPKVCCPQTTGDAISESSAKKFLDFLKMIDETLSMSDSNQTLPQYVWVSKSLRKQSPSYSDESVSGSQADLWDILKSSNPSDYDSKIDGNLLFSDLSLGSLVSDNFSIDANDEIFGKKHESIINSPYILLSWVYLGVLFAIVSIMIKCGSRNLKADVESKEILPRCTPVHEEV